MRNRLGTDFRRVLIGLKGIALGQFGYRLRIEILGFTARVYLIRSSRIGAAGMRPGSWEFVELQFDANNGEKATGWPTLTNKWVETR